MEKNEGKTHICKDILLRVSEFINGELSPSDMERFSAHISSCKSCKEMIEIETRFEEDLYKAIEEDLNTQTLDSPDMQQMKTDIIDVIKATPQSKTKTKITSIYGEKSDESINILNDKITHKPFKLNSKNVIGLFSLALVFALIFTIQNITNKNNHQANLKRSSYKKIFNKLNDYKNDREISTLFGYNQSTIYNGYISGISEKISSHDSGLQNTILHKIKRIKFTKRGKRKNITLSCIFSEPYPAP
jgi:hypothetical protein